MNQTVLDAMAFFLQKRDLTLDDVTYYRNPQSIHQHDPFYLRGMLPMVETLHQYRNSVIVIHPDYDADGVLSGTLMETGLSVLGFQHVFTYPPNVSDGYGLNIAAIDRILTLCPSVQVILTTDNGSNAIEAVRYARLKGLVVLVTDHHLAGDEPIGDVCINPNGHSDTTYPYKAISGTTVAYKVVSAYRSVYFEEDYREDVFQLFRFLVGVSVLSDVMPLHDENRYFVQEAIRLTELFLTQKEVSTEMGRVGDFKRGLYYLLHVLEREGKFKYGVDADTFGFYVGPLLNSPRRMFGSSDLAFRVFRVGLNGTADTAESLYALNEKRKAYVNGLRDALLDQIHDPLDSMVFKMDMLHGVAGLLSSVFTNTYHLPSIAFAYEGDLQDDTVLVGSGRAPNDFHLHDFVTMIASVYPDLIESFGGHAGAIGIRIRYKHLEAFTDVFITFYKQRYGVIEKTLQDVNTCDFVLPSPTIAPFSFEGAFYLPPTPLLKRDPLYHDLVVASRMLEPFGHLFEAPVYGISFTSDDVSSVFYMGAQKQHVRLELSNGLQLIVWSGRSNIEPLLSSDDVTAFVSTGRLSLNEFRGDVTVQYQADSLTVL